MSSKQVKRSTAAQVDAANKLNAVRSAHEARILDSCDFPTKATREAAERLGSYVFEVMTTATATLEEKDLAVGVERQDDDPAREARDEATQALYKLVTRMRPTLEAAMGESARARYGLVGQTPQVDGLLYQFASRAIGLMEQEPGVFTDLFGNEVRTANIVAMLKPATEALRVAREKVAAEDSELGGALLARDRQAERAARLTRAARLLEEALFVLADEEELWERSSR